MHSLFRRLFARPATADDLRALLKPAEERAAALEKRCAELESALRAWAEAHERLDLAFNSFRGRVYAWKKWEPRDEQPPAGTQTPQELPLSDPRVSKAELRARLIKPGKPFPHQS